MFCTRRTYPSHVLAPILAGIALVLMTAPSASASSRFDGPYVASYVPSQYTCNDIQVYDQSTCEYGYGGTWLGGGGSCDYTMGCYSGWMGAGDGCDCESDGTQCADSDCTGGTGGTCEVCYTTSAYYSGPERGDVLHFEAGAAAGVGTMVQEMAFGAGTKIHVAVCSSSYNNGECHQIWENTSTETVDSVFGGFGGCSDIKAWSSYDLQYLWPGIRWAAAGSTPYGQVTYFHTLDQTLIDNWSDNSYSHCGPGYSCPGDYYYQIAGFTRYHEYSTCSESVSDAMGLGPAEATGAINIDTTTVQGILDNAHSEIYSLCRDKIDGQGAWWCWSQGGHSGICNDIADRALNMFMDDPDRNKGTPIARPVTGVTAPEQQFCYMAGICSPQQTTGWLDRDDPSGSGDYEGYTQHGSPCPSGTSYVSTNIACVSGSCSDDTLTYYSSGGIACVNSSTNSCGDWKVQFVCSP